MGLGHLGLPKALLLARSGYRVHGVDGNLAMVRAINQYKDQIITLHFGNIASSRPPKYEFMVGNAPVPADTFIITVPVTIRNECECDISELENAVSSIVPCLRKGSLVIIESTCPVGTTQKMLGKIYQARPELRGHLLGAYCPTRADSLHELTYTDKLIGGMDPASTEKAASFYARVIKGTLHKTKAPTAELCKLVESTHRSVNVAFANEVSLICEKAGVNVWELLHLVNTNPKVCLLSPGCGASGVREVIHPCILGHQFCEESTLIRSAHTINHAKFNWVLQKIEEESGKQEKRLHRKPVLGLLGLTGRPDTDNLTASPALQIAAMLTERQYKIMCVEPNIPTNRINDLRLFPLDSVIKKADLLIALVAHSAFRVRQLHGKKNLLDFCGIASHTST